MLDLYSKHCISKKFDLFSSRSEFLLNQTGFFRSQPCIMLIEWTAFSMFLNCKKIENAKALRKVKSDV